MPNEFKIKNGLYIEGLSNVTNPHFLTINTASGQIYYAPTSSATSGPGTPGGNITQIQYNVDNATLGGVPTLTYSGSLLRATGSFSGSLNGIAATASFLPTLQSELNDAIIFNMFVG